LPDFCIVDAFFMLYFWCWPVAISSTLRQHMTHLSDARM